jgi:hypothetical protein
MKCPNPECKHEFDDPFEFGDHHNNYTINCPACTKLVKADTDWLRGQEPEDEEWCVLEKLILLPFPASLIVTNDTRPYDLKEFCGDFLKQFTGATFVSTDKGEQLIELGDEIERQYDGELIVKKAKK